MSLDQKMLAGFVREAHGYLRQSRAGIQAFHADPTQRQGLSEALRYVRTITGAAAMVGLVHFSHLTAYVAEALATMTAEQGPLDTAHATWLHRGVQQLEHYLDGLLAGDGQEQTIAAEIERSLRQLSDAPPLTGTGTEAFAAPAQQAQSIGGTDQTPARVQEGSGDLLEDFLTEAREYLATLSHIVATLASQPEPGALLQTVRRSVHTLKGTASIVGLRSVSQLLHRMEDLLEALDDGRLSMTTSVHALLCTTCEVLDDGVQAQSAQTRQWPAAEALYHSYAQMLGDMAGVPAQPKRLLEPLPRPDAVRAMPQAPAMAADLDGTRRRQGRLPNGRHETLTQRHMVPLATLATRLQRIVQVTAQQQGKEATLWLEGEGVTLDKTVLEAMAEPLLHLLRNALAHGIEPPALRQALGKPPCGQIYLRAFTKGAQVIMQVCDDGAGLEPQLLRAAAVRSGFVTASEAAQLTADQLSPLVFLPGFSTSQTMDEVAGRGMGMDIVQTTVRRLKGHIALTSTPGQGFTCTIRLPYAAGSPPTLEPA